MTDFLELLHTDIDARGQSIAEAIAPRIVELIGEGVDDWFDGGLCVSDRELWQSHLRSAIIYKTLKHLSPELEKSMSMHRDLVFTVLQLEHEESGE